MGKAYLGMATEKIDIGAHYTDRYYSLLYCHGFILCTTNNLDLPVP